MSGSTDSKTSLGASTTITLTQQDIYSGELLLLDATHPFVGKSELVLISSERPKNEMGSNIYSILGIQSLSLKPNVLKQFNSMASDFYKQSNDDNLLVFNAYDQTKSSQSAIYESGTALQLGYYSQDDSGEFIRNESIYGTDTYSWIYENCHKYGFIVLENEAETDNNGNSLGSNVFRYVGIPHAKVITERKISFESYLEYLKESSSYSSPLSTEVGSYKCAIYYLSANEPHAVPSKYEYTVSGNNSDGYIITVAIPKNK